MLWLFIFSPRRFVPKTLELLELLTRTIPAAHSQIKTKRCRTAAFDFVAAAALPFVLPRDSGSGRVLSFSRCEGIRALL
jgi:hypothetical protein